MNIKNVLINVLVCAVIVTVGLFVYNKFFAHNKIGFIRSGVLLQEYKELKSADEQYAKELKIAQDNVDTMKVRYEKLQIAYDASNNESEKKNIAMKLGSIKYEYDKYNEQASMQMDQRKQEITKKVLDNINNYVQEYGKKNNYRYILGTTNEGSLLYGNEAEDLTDILIKELNEQYDSAKK